MIQAIAIGISVMALFAGVKGSMKWEMILFSTGLGIFLVARWAEKNVSL